MSLPFLQNYLGLSSGLQTRQASTFNKTGNKAWYDFRETTGNLLNHASGADTMGTNADLTASGTITKTANAWNFSSTDGKAIETATDALAGTFSAYTLNCWIKPASTRAAYTFILTANDGNTNNFNSINTTAGGKIQGAVSGVGGTQIVIESTTSYSTSVKQMVTSVYDASLSGTARLKIYFNGTSEGTASGTPDATYTTGTKIAGVAVQGTSGQPQYTGIFYDGSIWSRALSASEITTLYNGGTPLAL